MGDPDTPARETCPATTMTSSDIILVDDESSTSDNNGSNYDHHANERLDLFLEDMGSYLEDRVQVVSFPGLSQYSMGGPSACGLIAMNCVRMFLSMESERTTRRELLKDMLRKETVSVSLLWSAISGGPPIFIHSLCAENSIHLRVLDKP